MGRWLMVLGCLAIPANAWATEVDFPDPEDFVRAGDFEVAIPVQSADASIIRILHVVRSPRAESGATLPGLEIALTCLPWNVPDSSEPHSLDQRQINHASALKFKVEVENRPKNRWRLVEGRSPSGTLDSVGGRSGHYVVDTLAVGLNVSALGADSASARILRIVGQDAYDPAVEATVAAILDNASRSEPPLTSIVLRIIGPNRYWRHAKFYPVTSAPVREFNNIPPAYRKSGR